MRRPGPARTYFYFLFGAGGGLSAWFAAELLFPIPDTGAALQIGPLLGQGAILGSLIGLGSGVYDGWAAGSFSRMIRFGGTSALLGLIAGCLALPMVQIVYGAAQTAGSSGVGLVTGVACWMLFGGLIGLGEGVSRGSQIWKGGLGGLLGGALGGLIYETLGRRASINVSAHSQVDSLGAATLAIATLLLGGFIGAAVALVSAMLKDSWLFIVEGKLLEHQIPVSKYVGTDPSRSRPGVIGSARTGVDICLPDKGVLPQHASIGCEGGILVLTVLDEARRGSAITRVNGRNVSSSFPLANGDKIQIGPVSMIYRTKARAKAAEEQ